MRARRNKKPSILGKGYLGQHTLGQRSAKTKYTYLSSFKQQRRKSQLPLPVDFYNAEIEGFREYKDGWAWGCCPFHPDGNPSFTMNLESGAFLCMSSSCGVKGGGIVSFVSQLHGFDLREAISYLEDWHA